MDNADDDKKQELWYEQCLFSYNNCKGDNAAELLVARANLLGSLASASTLREVTELEISDKLPDWSSAFDEIEKLANLPADRAIVCNISKDNVEESFLELYPEWKADSSDDEEDDIADFERQFNELFASNNNNDTAGPPAKQVKTCDASTQTVLDQTVEISVNEPQPTNTVTQVKVQDTSSTVVQSTVTNEPKFEAPVNPYAASRKATSNVQTTTDTSWDDYHHLQQQSNPFQTARDMFSSDKKTTSNTNNNRHSDKMYAPPPAVMNQQAYQHQQGNMYGTNNPYQYSTQTYNNSNNNINNNNDVMNISTIVQASPSSPPADPPPVIRDSLRRKFQPPKRSSNNRTDVQSSGTNNKTVGASKSTKSSKVTSSILKNKGRIVNNGGGDAAAVTTDTDKKSNSNNNTDNEEEELPEELQRFGKDLVEKIESEIMDAGDPITFDDIAGLEDAKQTIQEVICWPMKRPDLFTGLRKAPNGLLLYGPPGTGKTLIGKAIAHESGATFFSISSSSLTSKWIGEGEKLVRTLFAVAAYREPSVVFIDEIDSLLTQRKADENEASRRIKTEFLVQLDGTGTTGQGRVLVIGATNRPQELDEAARRRFTKRLYVPLPEENDREILIRVLLGKNNHQLTDAEIHKLAVETAGFSGADLKSLCTDAAMGPLRQLGAKALDVNVSDIPPISFKHCRQARRSMKPSVSPADLVQYQEWDKVYGSKRANDDNMDDDDDEKSDEDEIMS